MFKPINVREFFIKNATSIKKYYHKLNEEDLVLGVYELPSLLTEAKYMIKASSSKIVNNVRYDFVFPYTNYRSVTTLETDFYIDLLRSPTHNCQICSMGGIEPLIRKFAKNIPAFKKMMEMIAADSGKRLILFDISENKLQEALDNKLLDEKLIYDKNTIKSTNGSIRNLILYRTGTMY